MVDKTLQQELQILKIKKFNGVSPHQLNSSTLHVWNIKSCNPKGF